MRKQRIFFAMPVRRYIEPETLTTIKTKVYRPSSIYEITEHQERIGSPNIYYQHYNLARDFLKSTCDIYLYFDTDQIICGPDHALDIMVQRNKPILCPMIVRRIFPHLPTFMTYAQHAAIQRGDDPPFEDYRAHREPFEVQYCSGGVVLIRRDIMERVDKPFMPVFTKDGLILSVDYSFYHKARQVDPHCCWVDPVPEVAHIGHFPFMMNDYYQLLDTGELTKLREAGVITERGHNA